jgi:hypothetical protein
MGIHDDSAHHENALDFLDASTRRYWEPEFEGSELTLAG